MKKIVLLLVLVTLLLFSTAAQEISEKKEIAVFALGYHGWNVPSEALGLVDSQIINVFVNLGRFDVIGMTYRLGGADVGAFMNEIRRHKEDTIEIPEGVRLGEATFTEGDFKQLTNSFIVVIPVLSDYSAKKTIKDFGQKDQKDVWEVTLTTAFSFINVETLETFAHLNIETSSSGDTPRDALRSASDFIAPQLDFKIRSIPEFTLKTGVVEVLPNDRILLQFGQDMGVLPGDEFFLLRTQILSTGDELEEEKGLIKVEKVTQNISYGYVLSSDGQIAVGEQLKEIPRFGLELTPMARSMFSFDDSGSLFMAGLRFTVSRGLYRFRPLLGIEYIMGDKIKTNEGMPMKYYLGGEFVFHLKRFAIRPMIGFGSNGIIPFGNNKDFVLTHIGGFGEIQFSYLALPSLRFHGSFGYSYWMHLRDFSSLAGTLLEDDYHGVTAGLGMALKF